MITQFPLKGHRVAQKNTGSWKKPVYSYTATSMETGEIKPLTKVEFHQSLNVFKSSRK